ncbi:MAG: cbb3-type cytochrome c oxidase subunit I, partial [Planctomycetales bacterium]|nr:cbb3-type cytochrome c oxidase subunit I [Planctomycetales bacterium]
MSEAHPSADSGHGGEHSEHHELSFIRKYVFSTDHKMIGKQFLMSSFLFLLIGGGLAMGVRWQLGFPWKEIPIVGRLLWADQGSRMPPEFYTMMVSMHATIMIFFVIIPMLLGAWANFLIPLQIGARDMAFPKINMMSYWTMVPAFLIIVTSFFVSGGAGQAGWTSYPPLASVESAAPGSHLGQTLWLLSLVCVGLSSLLGSVNYITTIIKHRAPGMTMWRMPMATWSLFITAILQAFALPVLTAALILQILDRTVGTGFFIPRGLVVNNTPAGPGGGQPLLWQHLFWFYSHPAVYIMILPAMGMVSDIISTFSRKPLFGYHMMVIAIAGIAGLGFIVWGHHMFQSGMNPALGAAFMVNTLLIGLPSAIKVFNWISTMVGARIQFTAQMLFAIAFVSMFIIGGLSGIFMAATPVDIYIHDTYYIVAHIHYVLFSSSLMGIFAAVYHWYPKMFGRHMDDRWGKLHFALTFVFLNFVFFPMHILGVGGMPRRYADPYHVETFAHMLPMNTFISVSAFCL